MKSSALTTKTTTSLAVLALFLCLAVANVRGTLPFEGSWQQVAIASFLGTSVNSFTGAFQVPAAPEDGGFFAVVLKLESVTVTEGIATIVTWNQNASAYTLQLYYTTNGVDQTYSDTLAVRPESNVTFYEQYDYSNEQWTVGANVTDTSESLFLSFPEGLTLSLASIELATNGTYCGQLPSSDYFTVSQIGYNCGFVGCGPWMMDSWGECQTSISAHGSQASFSFNSTASYLQQDDHIFSLKYKESAVADDASSKKTNKKYI